MIFLFQMTETFEELAKAHMYLHGLMESKKELNNQASEIQGYKWVLGMVRTSFLESVRIVFPALICKISSLSFQSCLSPHSAGMAVERL